MECTYHDCARGGTAQHNTPLCPIKPPLIIFDSRPLATPFNLSGSALLSLLTALCAVQMESVEQAEAAIATYNRYLVVSEDDPDDEFNLIVAHAR